MDYLELEAETNQQRIEIDQLKEEVRQLNLKLDALFELLRQHLEG